MMFFITECWDQEKDSNNALTEHNEVRKEKTNSGEDNGAFRLRWKPPFVFSFLYFLLHILHSIILMITHL